MEIIISDRTILRTIVSMKSFPSLIDDIITLTTATSNVVLPNIVVANLPANITVIDTVAILTPRALNNTNAATNAINGAGAVNIKAAAGAWGVDDVALITISDNILSTAASTKEGGRPIKGTHDASSVVTGNGTYNLRFDGNIFVDGNNLELIDVDVVLEVYFIPS